MIMKGKETTWQDSAFVIHLTPAIWKADEQK